MVNSGPLGRRLVHPSISRLSIHGYVPQRLSPRLFQGHVLNKPTGSAICSFDFHTYTVLNDVESLPNKPSQTDIPIPPISEVLTPNSSNKPSTAPSINSTSGSVSPQPSENNPQKAVIFLFFRGIVN